MLKMQQLLRVFISFFCFFLYFVVADQTGVQEKHCECVNYDCGCCTRLEVKTVIDGKLCSNFSYLPDEYGISVTITYNDNTIYNETVSAKNPPPICLIHFDDIKMEICFRFYDLDIKNKIFSGCAEFDVAFFKILRPMKIKLGCFGKNTTLLTAELQNMLDYISDKSKRYNNEPNVVLI